MTQESTRNLEMNKEQGMVGECKVLTASTAHAILSPDGHYTYDSDGFVHQDGRIYIPSHSNLQLRVLQYKHDHLISGHLGIANTTKVVLIEYYWPGVHAFVKSYCISDVICKCGKAPQH